MYTIRIDIETGFAHSDDDLKIDGLEAEVSKSPGQDGKGGPGLSLWGRCTDEALEAIGALSWVRGVSIIGECFPG